MSFKGKVEAKTASSNETSTNEKKIASHHSLLIKVSAGVADAHALLVDDDGDGERGGLAGPSRGGKPRLDHRWMRGKIQQHLQIIFKNALYPLRGQQSLYLCDASKTQRIKCHVKKRSAGHWQKRKR